MSHTCIPKGTYKIDGKMAKLKKTCPKGFGLKLAKLGLKTPLKK